jgi:hypothetical protein
MGQQGFETHSTRYSSGSLLNHAAVFGVCYCCGCLQGYGLPGQLMGQQGSESYSMQDGQEEEDEATKLAKAEADAEGVFAQLLQRVQGCKRVQGKWA